MENHREKKVEKGKQYQDLCKSDYYFTSDETSNAAHLF